MLDTPEDETPAAEVHRDSYDVMAGLNWSRLRLLERSPLHFKTGYGEDTASLKLGTAVHMAILEPARFAETYIVTQLRRDKRTKAWQECEADATRAGKLVMIQSEYDNTSRIRDAVLSKPRAVHYLSGGKPERTIQWKFKSPPGSPVEFEFDCKGREDYDGPLAIVDLKSTQNASPRAFPHSCRKYGYFGQGAWYSDGHFLATGERKPFVIIAVESAAPHAVQVYVMDPAALERGREQYRALLGTLDYCNKHNFWSGYTEEQEVPLNVPEGWLEAV